MNFVLIKRNISFGKNIKKKNKVLGKEEINQIREIKEKYKLPV